MEFNNKLNVKLRLIVRKIYNSKFENKFQTHVVRGEIQNFNWSYLVVDKFTENGFKVQQSI
jgi:hypothetical protein